MEPGITHLTETQDPKNARLPRTIVPQPREKAADRGEPDKVRQNLRDFLQKFGELLQLRQEWLAEGVVTLNFNAEQARLLEGLRARTRTLTLLLDPAQGKNHPQGELFTPGSYRLDQFIEIAQSRGKLCRQYVVRLPGALGAALADPELEADSDGGQFRYEPHLLVHWRLSYLADHFVRRHVTDLTVNLVTGEMHQHYYSHLGACDVSDSPVGSLPRARRRLTFKAAYQKMCKEIQHQLAAESTEWADEANQRLQEEIEALEQYFAGRVGEAPAEILQAEKEKRLAELYHKTRPRVLASPLACALLYVPIITYRDLELDGEHFQLRYDPVIHRPL